MKKRSSFHLRIALCLFLFFAVSFLLPASHDGNARLYLLAAIVPGAILILLMMPSGFFSLDRPSLSAALMLSAFGILASAAVLPDSAVSQGLRCVAGLIALTAGVVWVRFFRPSFLSSFFPAIVGLLLISFPFFIPEISFSMTEGGIILLLIAVSSFLTLRLRLPALILSLCGLLLLLSSADIASAAVCAFCCVLLFWVVSDSTLWSGIMLLSAGGLLAGSAGFFLRAPESSAEHAFSGLSSMSLILPEFTEEAAAPESPGSLFLTFGQMYGLIMLLCAVLLLVLILIRGTSLAIHTRKAFHASLAFIAVLLMGLRSLLFLLSLSGLLPPLAGDFPLLSSSLSDLLAHFFLIGILSGVSSRNETDLKEDVRLSMLAR